MFPCTRIAMLPLAASVMCSAAACDHSSPTILAPASEWSTVPANLADASMLQEPSATGHGEIFHPFGTHPLTQFSISAITHADGSVSGQFELSIFVRFHGTVKCVSVQGNLARVGLVIVQSDNPNLLPGSEAYVTLVDNGEGEADPPDRLSPPLPGNAQRHCDVGLFAPLVDILRGNIQVRS